jgi:hypothetical protein
MFLSGQLRQQPAKASGKKMVKNKAAIGPTTTFSAIG